MVDEIRTEGEGEATGFALWSRKRCSSDCGAIKRNPSTGKSGKRQKAQMQVRSGPSVDGVGQAFLRMGWVWGKACAMAVASGVVVGWPQPPALTPL